MPSTPVLVLHGGAGTISRSMSPEKNTAYRRALSEIAAAGRDVLAAGGSAVDAVTETVRLLEENPLFNAAYGAVLTSAGEVELDAAVMRGQDRAAGAVTSVRRLRNPVLAARQVMEHSHHVLFCGAGAEAFAAEHGAELVDPDWFVLPERREQLERVRAQDPHAFVVDHDAAGLAAENQEGDEAEASLASGGDPIEPDSKRGTVGAVALDAAGHLAAATSTGGITNKQPGRVGDTPIFGAGTYADDRSCAVSATGMGEGFMRAVAAHEIAALMTYAGLSLTEAAATVIHERLPEVGGDGGLIAVDAQGNVSLPMNTTGMYRAVARVGGELQAAIHADEAV
ncbi:isoaspartyl peptidase/L-asparaginase family protein [Bogoriella caseilytica]|uniref:Asparaginase n=1 Tax=Bogoriella caseilytica TaxID=56055 RepID=A0A3N2BBV3_9MICO|nr:isoaspartyl peptidase/L-asparaginase [Bogoriella caseilytica]ROR72726.1 asparaginase [Bogoriella caseilytica]